MGGVGGEEETGREDFGLSGGAATVVRAVGMAARRCEVVRFARDLFGNGARWPDILAHTQHPSGCGYIEECHELQEPEDPDEPRPDSETEAADLREAQAVGDWASTAATVDAAKGAWRPSSSATTQRTGPWRKSTCSHVQTCPGWRQRPRRRA